MPTPLLALLDDEASVRAWLEIQLVGPRLLEVVRDLTQLTSERTGDGAASATLTSYQGAILERGLAALTDEEIQVLFRNPSLLLRVQEWVLVDGGPYWDGVLSGAAAPTLSPSLPPDILPVCIARAGLRRRVLTHAAALVAGAAAVLIAWLVAGPGSPPAPQKERVRIASETPADAALSTLAGQIDTEWSGARRQADTASALRTLQQTCEALANADFSQLSDSARTAIRQDLLRLTREVESRRRTLEQGGDVWQVRAEVDSLVNCLLSRRWRDPEDLPEVNRDPDDLPGVVGGG